MSSIPAKYATKMMSTATTDKRVFEQEATVESWDDDYYHPVSLRLFDWAVADMLKAMNVEPGSTVLDAGCGPGVHSIRVAQAGFDVHAIDISSTMLKHAHQRVQAAGCSDRVKFGQEDLTKLSFEDESFEFVFSWGVIIHIQNAAQALHELGRIVKPGGKLALFIVNQSALDNKIERLLRMFTRKPLNIKDRSLGDGIQYDMHGKPLWLWQFDMSRVGEALGQHQMKMVYRRTGEFSELQRRTKGWIRSGLLHLNNAAYKCRVFPQLARTNLVVFEKAK